MIVPTINRMARSMDYPSLAPDSVSLVSEVSAPGTDFQNASYGMAGLGSVFNDISSGNIAALPGDFIAGLNPATFDIGSYLILGAVALFFLPHLIPQSKAEQRYKRRKAYLAGKVAQDQTLLKEGV